MIEQELTEEEPTVLQTIESAEDGGNDVALEAADAPQSTSDTGTVHVFITEPDLEVV